MVTNRSRKAISICYLVFELKKKNEHQKRKKYHETKIRSSHFPFCAFLGKQMICMMKEIEYHSEMNGNRNIFFFFEIDNVSYQILL